MLRHGRISSGGLPDDDDIKPSGKSDGYASVYKSGSTARIYFFVDGARYYVGGTADAEVVVAVGNPFGAWLFWFTYAG